jgi:hypothetical protein
VRCEVLQLCVRSGKGCCHFVEEDWEVAGRK